MKTPTKTTTRREVPGAPHKAPKPVKFVFLWGTDYLLARMRAEMMKEFPSFQLLAELGIQCLGELDRKLKKNGELKPKKLW
jgi:hypothetical protein